MRSFRLPLLGSALAALIVGCTPAASVPAGPAVVQAPQTPAEQPVALPNLDDSLKFAVLGDFGTGERIQFELANQMTKAHARFPFDLVVLVGDNLYGSERPQDFEQKFEIPYKALLDAKVKFQASLGNHDAREQASYKHFNMDGKLYYSFKASKQSVRFFALDTTFPKPDQITWVEDELKNSGEDWKIPYFHHPLYSSGERHGSHLALRKTLEPLFLKYNVSVVLTGHDHFYERTKPQQGIVYFVAGSGGKLRAGNIDRSSGITAKGFDTDLAFMICEINKDQMYFQTISRSGAIVDSGVITRRVPPK
jgi:hypothetical protein